MRNSVSGGVFTGQDLPVLHIRTTHVIDIRMKNMTLRMNNGSQFINLNEIYVLF